MNRIIKERSVVRIEKSENGTYLHIVDSYADWLREPRRLTIWWPKELAFRRKK